MITASQSHLTPDTHHPCLSLFFFCMRVSPGHTMPGVSRNLSSVFTDSGSLNLWRYSEMSSDTRSVVQCHHLPCCKWTQICSGSMIFKISRLLNLSSVSCPDYFNAVPRERRTMFSYNISMLSTQTLCRWLSVFEKIKYVSGYGGWGRLMLVVIVTETGSCRVWN